MAAPPRDWTFRWARAGVWVVIGLAVCLALMGGYYSYARKRRLLSKTYTIGFDVDPPYQVVREDGSPGGLAVETVRLAAQRAGIRLRWVRFDGPPETALSRGLVDLWPLMTDLPYRRKLVHMTTPWLATESCLLVRESSPIRQSQDAHGLRIAYKSLPIFEKRIREEWSPRQHIQLPAPEDVVKAVCEGRADAGYMDGIRTVTILLKGSGCRSSPLRLVSVPSLRSKLTVASTFESARAADAIRAEIGRLSRDGSLGPILNQWAYFDAQHVASIIELIDAQRRETFFYTIIGVVTLLLAATVWQSYGLSRARHAAERASASKSAFLATVSHEIRTPMGGVIGLTRILKDTPLNAEQAELAASIERCSESLLALVDDILDLSKIEAGKLTLEHEGFSPRELIGNIGSILGPSAREKGLALTVTAASALPQRAKGDPLRLRQILFNLVSNALKFTERGSIEIAAGVEPGPDSPDRLWFEVRDTGIGIPQDAIPRLFAPYVQAQSSTIRKFGGFGLGLAISKRLVEAMGGIIGVTSRPGSGSVFRFAIPFVPDFAPAEAAPAPGESADALPAAPATPLRILVAEDNVVNQRLMRYLLEKLGHSVRVVSNGAEAVEECLAGAYDVVLMDCQMPEMDGYEATRRIRRREPAGRRTPIVAVTAYAMQGDREACLEAGMEDHLAKPVDLRSVARVLQRWSRGPRYDNLPVV